MVEKAKPDHIKQDKIDRRHRKRQQDSEPSFDQSLAWDTGPFSLRETPFYPRMEEHAAMLSSIPSAVQRKNFIMRLHQTYGNRYVQRLMESTDVQAKLTISNPGDIYEQEADRVADAVTRAVNYPVQRQEEEEELLQGKPLIKRQEEEEELLQGKSLVVQQQPEEEEEVQMTPDFQRQEEEEELLQGKPLIKRQEEEKELQAHPDESQLAEVSDNIEARINSARGGGQPLPDDVREPMEQAFGADFNGVRVHTDSESDLLNKELSAKAFTTARDIFFRQDEYSPGSDSGRKLIAHELAHVVQQSSGQQATHSRVIQRSWECTRCHTINLENKWRCRGCGAFRWWWRSQTPLKALNNMDYAGALQGGYTASGGNLQTGVADMTKFPPDSGEHKSLKRFIAQSHFLYAQAQIIGSALKAAIQGLQRQDDKLTAITDLDAKYITPKLRPVGTPTITAAGHDRHRKEMIKNPDFIDTYLGWGLQLLQQRTTDAGNAEGVTRYFDDVARNMGAKGYAYWCDVIERHATIPPAPGAPVTINLDDYTVYDPATAEEVEDRSTVKPPGKFGFYSTLTQEYIKGEVTARTDNNVTVQVSQEKG